MRGRWQRPAGSSQPGSTAVGGGESGTGTRRPEPAAGIRGPAPPGRASALRVSRSRRDGVPLGDLRGPRLSHPRAYRPGGESGRCEAFERSGHVPGHLLASMLTGADQVQLCARPGPGQAPGHIGGRSEVEPAIWVGHAGQPLAASWSVPCVRALGGATWRLDPGDNCRPRAQLRTMRRTGLPPHSWSRSGSPASSPVTSVAARPTLRAPPGGTRGDKSITPGTRGPASRPRPNDDGAGPSARSSAHPSPVVPPPAT